ncbi:MAG: hypothetical protein AABY53_09765 [Bdellovibrionota bacterium]
MDALIKKEYFELINRLNQSNKLKNQTTEIYFYIDEGDLSGAKLYAAISNVQKILLCEKDSAQLWSAVYFSDFTNLEDFIAAILNEHKKYSGTLTDFIKLHIFKLG